VTRKAPRAAKPGGPWANLLTESRNPRSAALDTLPTGDVVALLLDEDRRALRAALREQRSITRAADEAARVLAGAGRIVFLGAGTSGRLGVLEAAECPPTFGSDPARIRAVMAGGEGAVFRAVEGAEDDEEAGRAAGTALGSGDLLVGISASSVTPYVRGGLAAAREKGARTVLVTCAPSPALRRLADVVVAVPTGPEVLTGSTRLKAGSATKAVLNAITTAAMVRQGKAYGNLMVDLRRGNAKLVDRARRIVESAGRVDAARANQLLAASGGEAKTAIVMARLDVDADEAQRRLAEAGGHVRVAVGEARPRRSRRARGSPGSG
jgi:N-acetylmuramic acid 6-phosphate etherase